VTSRALFKIHPVSQVLATKLEGRDGYIYIYHAREKRGMIKNNVIGRDLGLYT